MELRVTLDAAEVDAALNRLTSPAFKHRLLTKLGETIKTQTKLRISSEKRSPDGKPWAPWRPSTAARRKGGSLLQDTGALMGGIHKSVAGDTLTVGSGVFYGAFHQFGTRKMVARPFLGLSSANARQLENQALRLLIGAL